MDGYLLDTNVLVALLRPAHTSGGAIKKRIAALPQGSPLSVSVAALAELEVGCVLRDTDREEAQREIGEMIAYNGFMVRDFTKHSAAQYGELKAALMAKYNRKRPKRPEEWPLPDTAGKLCIDEFDLLMVAHAMAYRLVLVTNDKMARVRKGLKDVATDLRIEDWSASQSEAAE